MHLFVSGLLSWGFHMFLTLDLRHDWHFIISPLPWEGGFDNLLHTLHPRPSDRNTGYAELMTNLCLSVLLKCVFLSSLIGFFF